MDYLDDILILFFALSPLLFLTSSDKEKYVRKELSSDSQTAFIGTYECRQCNEDPTRSGPATEFPYSYGGACPRCGNQMTISS